MSKVIKFGEDVEGYNIPVLNEREIRAAAGILFLAMFISIMTVIFTGNFLILKYAVHQLVPFKNSNTYIYPL